MIRRERTAGGKTTVGVVSGITSLSAAADAGRLLGLVREHWKIESCSRYVRDVTLGEDAGRVRRGSAAPVLAALGNAAVPLRAGVKAESRPAAVEDLSARPNAAMGLIGLPEFE